MTTRYAFVISDRTGITAEALGHSLLSQFPTVNIQTETLPFIDNAEKVEDAVAQINKAAKETGLKPLVFATLVDDNIREEISRSEGVFFDLFDTFIDPIEKELGIASSHSVGQSHGVVDLAEYTARISAVNYSLNTDDGVEVDHYGRADVIIIGVSRTGKTPTCLYLALHYGIYASNYPLTMDDLERREIPAELLAHPEKLYGLTIDPFRLQQIRQERYNRDSYASARQCEFEIATAEQMFRSARVPFINTTQMSIEEISTTIMHKTGLKRKI